MWRLSARRQPSAGAAWLAEPRFATRVYDYGSTAPCLIIQRDLPVGEGGNPEAHSRLLWATRPQLHEAPGLSAGPQTGQFGRSEAEAKLHRSGLNPRTTAASCEAIRGLDYGTWVLRRLLDHDRLHRRSRRLRFSLRRDRPLALACDYQYTQYDVGGWRAASTGGSRMSAPSRDAAIIDSEPVLALTKDPVWVLRSPVMATKPEVPLPDRISASFQELADSAASLNSASDELANAIRPIDAALKKLNLGVAAWYPYNSYHDDDYYSSRRIGYARVGRTWGLALSTASGYLGSDEENVEEWLFNDAPRWMRVEAVDHIPDLLQHLAKQANRVTADLQKKTEKARELAGTISALSEAKAKR